MAKGLAAALEESAAMYRQLVDDGTTPEAASKIVGQGLYVEWGAGHETLYRCSVCHDTGFTMKRHDASRMYGPGASEQRATACDPFCPFRVHEREMRQRALGARKERRDAHS